MNAPFYFLVGVPLVGILVNVVLFTSLGRRMDRLADWLEERSAS